MGKRGPVGMSNRENRELGNPMGRRKDASGASELERVERASVPTCPLPLGYRGKKYWKELCLSTAGQRVSDEKLHGLARLCFLREQYWIVAKNIQSDDFEFGSEGSTGQATVAPDFKLLKELGDQILRLEAKYFLTPADEVRGAKEASEVEGNYQKYLERIAERGRVRSLEVD